MAPPPLARHLGALTPFPAALHRSVSPNSSCNNSLFRLLCGFEANRRSSSLLTRLPRPLVGARPVLEPMWASWSYLVLIHALAPSGVSVCVHLRDPSMASSRCDNSSGASFRCTAKHQCHKRRLHNNTVMLLRIIGRTGSSDWQLSCCCAAWLKRISVHSPNAPGSRFLSGKGVKSAPPVFACRNNGR